MFGAGATVNQAWLPAVRTVGSQTFSVLGCTTIHGSQHPISYVASAEQSKSGAALCEAKRLQASVRAARALGRASGGQSTDLRPAAVAAA